MIPKIIHYCWFGKKEKPDFVDKMIETWKKNCPDYKIMEWNEDNFDIHINQYVEQAYQNKKYAFVSDVARLYALLNVGGIYLDTDVELLKPLDELLSSELFIGFQDTKNINTGLIASEKDNKTIKKMFEQYNNKTFIKTNGEFDMTTNVKIITKILIDKGLKLNNQRQKIENIEIYPTEFFCPIDYVTGKKNISKRTYAIHWFGSSWLPPIVRFRKKITKRIYRIFGKDCLNWMKKK